MYHEVKEMNLAEIQKIKEKIIKCDKIIHMQQLGVVWEAPKNGREGEIEGEFIFTLSPVANYIGDPTSMEEGLNVTSMGSAKDETQLMEEEIEEEDKSIVEEDEGQYDVRLWLSSAVD